MQPCSSGNFDFVQGYAAALRGLLNNAGARLSAPVVSKLGGMLVATLPTAGLPLTQQPMASVETSSCCCGICAKSLTKTEARWYSSLSLLQMRMERQSFSTSVFCRRGRGADLGVGGLPGRLGGARRRVRAVGGAGCGAAVGRAGRRLAPAPGRGPHAGVHHPARASQVPVVLPHSSLQEEVTHSCIDEDCAGPFSRRSGAVLVPRFHPLARTAQWPACSDDLQAAV